MAEKTMADYFTVTSVADYTTETLNIPCQVEIEETPQKRQLECEFDDGSVDVVNVSETIWFDGTLQWPEGISKSDAGTIMDLYTNSTKADFKRRSIYWQHPVEGNTYVIKFRGQLTRTWTHDAYNFIKIPQIPIRVIGKKA